jgi:hypothetical protein
MRNAQNSETPTLKMGIPGSVALESCAAPVMTEAVSFDDHSAVAPDEVHLVGA